MQVKCLVTLENSTREKFPHAVPLELVKKTSKVYLKVT